MWLRKSSEMESKDWEMPQMWGRHEENGYCLDGGLRSGIKSIERRDIRKKQTIQLFEEMQLTDPADTEQLFCL
jgi:hypothetical protein